MLLIMSGAPAKNEPQMNADERRFIVPGLCLNQRGAGSLRAQKRDYASGGESLREERIFASGRRKRVEGGWVIIVYEA